jgi:hypothetical protein
MGKVQTRSQSVAKKKPPKKKKSGISKPKSSGKRNPKLVAKSGGGTAAKAASKKGMSHLRRTATMKIVIMRELKLRTMTTMWRQLMEMTVVLMRTVKCQPKVNVRAAIVLKSGEGAMIHTVTRDAVTVILPPMLLLAEVVLHAAPVPPPEKIQVKACLLHL